MGEPADTTTDGRPAGVGDPPAKPVPGAILRASGGTCLAQDRVAPPRRPRRRERDEALYERWLARQTKRLDPLMAFAGVVFTLLVAFQFADPRLSPSWSRTLDASIWLLWSIFVVDFIAKAVAAPSAVVFAHRRWLTVAMLLVPTLRLLRNAATRGGKLEHRASVAQWKAELMARRPKTAKLAANEDLREYVQERLAGQVRRPDGAAVPGPATKAWRGRNKPHRQDRRRAARGRAGDAWRR